jgi:hypothetical protein
MGHVTCVSRLLKGSFHAVDRLQGQKMPNGFNLLLLCLFAFSCGAFAQSTPIFETPKSVWWRGHSVTLVKYRNDGSCLSIATNSSVINGYGSFDEQNGWLGGIDQITFKMDGTSCVKVPTRKIGNPGNTWVQMFFQQGYKGCTIGYNQGSMAELRFFSDSECRQGNWQSVVNQYDLQGQFPREEDCFYDRGAASNPPQGIIYYRMFCDVPAPNSTLPVYIHTNIHTNITTFVPTIVKPDDLIPLIQSLMKTNASLFKSLSVLSVSPPSNSNSSSVNGPPNQQKQESSGIRLDVPLLILAGVPALFFFLLV